MALQSQPDTCSVSARPQARKSEFQESPRGNEVNVYEAYLSMLDFIDNELPYMRSDAEVRAHLVIWRQTHGWGKVSDPIGRKEFERRTGMGHEAVRTGIDGVEQHGVVLVESTIQTTAAGKLLAMRQRYTWPVNDRVQAVIERGKNAEVQDGDGGVDRKPAYPLDRKPAHPWTGNRPTQSCTSSSSVLNNLVPSSPEPREGTGLPQEKPKTEPLSLKTDDDEKPKNPKPEGMTPDQEFLWRLRQRHHGTIADPEQVLQDVKAELLDAPITKFLEADEAATTNPAALLNPHGHYRKLARKVGRHHAMAPVASILETRDAVRKAMEQSQIVEDAKPKCPKCGGGGMLSQQPPKYCDCHMGQEVERTMRLIEQRRASITLDTANAA